MTKTWGAWIVVVALGCASPRPETDRFDGGPRDGAGPSADAGDADDTAVDSPGSDLPAGDVAGSDLAAIDAPTGDAPAADAPAADALSVDVPTVDATGPDGPPADTSSADAPPGECAPGASEACYTGPAATRHVGACRDGARACVSGRWTPCAGQVLPAANEVCGGNDANCNGVVDEGCGACTPGASQSCYSGPAGTAGMGRCHAGSQLCAAGRTWGPCAGEVGPTVEVCNNLDDNCNGMVDESPAETSCPDRAHATPTCAAGVCGFACGPGSADCDGDPASGCEATLATDAANCGACHRACAAPTGGSAGCAGGVCGSACPGAQSNCAGTCRVTGAPCTSSGAGGCEQAGTVACNGSGTACSASARTSGPCTSPANGVCSFSGTCGCAFGLSDCGGVCRPTGALCPGTDGCSDGRIGCVGSGVTACVGSSAPFGNGAPCDVPRNGLCESGCVCAGSGIALCGTACANTAEDHDHCGSCAHACGAAEVCVSSMCRTAGMAGVMPPYNDHPANATPIGGAGRSSQTLAVDTTFATNDVTSVPCGVSNGRDVFYSFTLAQRELVYADTIGATWDTQLFFLRNDTFPPMPVLASALPPMRGTACNDDGGLTGCATGAQSQVLALLPAGSYLLALSGRGHGYALIRFHHLPAGNGQVAYLAAGAWSPAGATFGTGIVSDATGLCCSDGPEDTYYWYTCDGDPGGNFSASSCSPSTAFDTTLVQRSAAWFAPTSVCNEDACGVQSYIGDTILPGAGLHALYVDGCERRGNGHGAYALSVTRP